MRQQKELGREAGQQVLAAAGPAPALGMGREVLPSLEEAADAPRPMWRHPAFIVSAILTILALAAAAAFAILGIFGGKGEVSRAAIETSSGNVHLTWQASGPVSLYVVTNGQAQDLTQLISGENEAWVPSALNLYTQASCFVVRPASDKPAKVTLDGGELAKQHAASVCVSGGTSQ